MIEDTLEEELLSEFRGGTLTINESKTNEDKAIKNDSPKASNDNSWGANFIPPIASIPKISATLWCKNHKSPKSETAVQPVICIEDPNNFFTFRESVLARALNECKEQFLDEEADGPLVDAFLLTQISHWNSDKERLLLLTTHTLLICKYDFIALKRLSYKKLPLEMVEEIVYGELVYPSASLIPQMSGIVDGISNALEACLLSRKNENKEISNIFRPRSRNMKGVRLIWNNAKALSFTTNWNPFNDDVPFCTFTFHPLYFHKDCADEKLKNLYSLDVFVEKIAKVIADSPKNEETKAACTIQEKEIVLQTYLGIGSVIHNRNSLGFFKVRGKFSF